jgi:hypothetical protein
LKINDEIKTIFLTLKKNTIMKKIAISIPKPCSEKWTEMEVAEEGRFCQSCEKTVIDFTKFSDKELLAFFLNN